MAETGPRYPIIIEVYLYVPLQLFLLKSKVLSGLFEIGQHQPISNNLEYFYWPIIRIF